MDAMWPRTILTVALALGGCRQILGFEEAIVPTGTSVDDAGVDALVDASIDAGGDASIDAGSDASTKDPCDYQLAFTIPTPGNFSGLGATGGVLYGFELTTPRRIVSINDAGMRVLIQSVAYTSVGLAASATHLYTDDEAGGQTIREILIADPTTQRTLTSAITGGNRGLAVVGNRIWHLGARGSIVGFSEIRISDGVFVAHHPASNAIDANNADSDGAHLLYVTSALEGGVNVGTLHVLDLSGAVRCTRALPLPATGDSYEVLGLAVDGRRLYVYDRNAAAIYVLLAPP